jgi:hypothetical protein
VRGASTASPTRRRGLFGGWAQAIYLEPGVGSRGCPTRPFDDYIGAGCGLLTAVHILERAALRPGDTCWCRALAPSD